MNKILFITIAIILTIGLVACSNSKLQVPETTEPIKPTESIPEMIIPEETEPMAKNDLSAAILDMSYAETKDNTMFSPLSLDMAIALVAEGAEDKECFSRFLGRNNYSEFAAKYFSRMEYLNQDAQFSYMNYKTLFEIANAVYVDTEYMLQDKYLEATRKYNAETTTLDFSDKVLSVNTINKWAAEKTHDMIPAIIQESNLKDNTMMLALNAIYFESPWSKSWIVGNPNDFTLFDGTKLNVPMIQAKNKLYYENDKATAFGSRYMNGFVFIGILPKAEGEFNVQDLDIDSLLESESTEYVVNSTMPKFKFENTTGDLMNYLTTLGYGEMFEENALPYIASMNDENASLNISGIIQADAIELDENGTKAAAVTAIMVETTGITETPPEEKTVILDRPFAFLIYDPEMKQIVFMGKVVSL